MSVKDQPKRLGRGLAALLGEAATPSTVNAPGVQNLPVDLLEPSPYQPRQEMDDTALQELADSISQRGILQPLLVRPHPENPGTYQIIAGERRWRAAQRVSLHEVPVLVRALSDADAMAAGLVENLQREDLNAVEEAEGYQRLISEFKLTQDTLADAVGKSRAHIGNALRVLKLPDKVLGMVRDGSLSMGHARALLNHSDPVKGAKVILDKDLSVRQTEAMIDDLGRTFTSKMLRKPPPERGLLVEGEAESLARNLSERLGLRVRIAYNGKGGTVSLNYANLDQLDALLALLNG
ncbi:MAG: chromosome partitioning protein ParB [Acidocella sp. 20-63-7]|nr:MAG: chromosome partitioning protein ParB [Acidocella sp. 20-63-7]HQT45909.1 ParB/RepB/Spo0J family partition protein [Acidocella sp.]